MRSELHLRGCLQHGPHGLVLRANGGGMWEVEERRRARRLVGEEVELVGTRSGFNLVSCDQIWPAGQPRPRPSKINVEFLLAPGLVGLALIAIALITLAYVNRDFGL